MAQAVFDRDVGIYGQRGYSQEEGEKERKGGEGYHGERSAEADREAVNESAGFAPDLDRSVGLEPRTAEHAHVSLRSRWKPSNASSLLFFLLLLCRLQQHKAFIPVLVFILHSQLLQVRCKYCVCFYTSLHTDCLYTNSARHPCTVLPNILTQKKLR